MKRWSIGVLLEIAFLMGLIAMLAVPLTKEAVAASPVTLKVLDPRGELPTQPVFGISPRIADLNGKKIGLVDNTKPGAKYLFDRLEQELKRRFPTSTIFRFRKSDYKDVQTNLYKEVAAKTDAFIFGVGD